MTLFHAAMWDEAVSTVGVVWCGAEAVMCMVLAVCGCGSDVGTVYADLSGSEARRDVSGLMLISYLLRDSVRRRWLWFVSGRRWRRGRVMVC